MSLAVPVYFYWIGYDAAPIPLSEDNFEILSDKASLEERQSWEKYTDPEYGYSFMYPMDLSIKATANQQRITPTMREKGELGLRFTISVKEEDIERGSFTSYARQQIEELLLQSASGDKVPGKEQHVSVHLAELSGKPAVVGEDSELPNWLNRTLFVWHRNKVIEIDVLIKREDAALFSKILSTFEFYE